MQSAGKVLAPISACLLLAVGLYGFVGSFFPGGTGWDAIFGDMFMIVGMWILVTWMKRQEWASCLRAPGSHSDRSTTSGRPSTGAVRRVYRVLIISGTLLLALALLVRRERWYVDMVGAFVWLVPGAILLIRCRSNPRFNYQL